MWHVLPCGLPSTSLKSLHEEDPSQLLLRIGDRHRRRRTAGLRSDTLNTSPLALIWSGRSYANWSKFRGLVLGCIKADFFRSDIRFATFFQIYKICALLHQFLHHYNLNIFRMTVSDVVEQQIIEIKVQQTLNEPSKVASMCFESV